MLNKIDPRSLACVFLGYNDKYKGYRCYYPPTGRVFISHHVLFDEQSFPFEDIYQRFHKASDSHLLNAWRKAHLAPPLSSSGSAQAPEEEPLPARVQLEDPIVAPTPVTVTANDPLPQDHSGDAPPVVHPMTTRARAGIVKPNLWYALLTVKDEFTEPKSLKAALQHPGWNNTMGVEVANMSETGTFELVPPEEDQNPLSCGWVRKVKRNADGSVLKLKSRLVARGNEQEEGLDYIETFSPVVRSATIRTVLHVAVTKKWSLKQLDVQNAFLHGDLKERVIMKQPPGFENPDKPDYVWRLKKAIYGLKQAPRTWFDKFSFFLLDFEFKCSFSDPSLFIYHLDQMSSIFSCMLMT